MKKGTIAGIVGLIIVIVGVAVTTLALGHKSNPTSTVPSTSANKSTQVVPVASNPIQNTSTQTGLSIINPVVENNTDPATGQAVADRLQFSIKNSSNQTMNNFAAYYTMTDTKTHQSENYYLKLNGLTIDAGQTETVFFDSGSGAGHYPDNQYSIYRTSKNAVDFTIEVSVPGFQPATAHAQKGPGTGDRKD